MENPYIADVTAKIAGDVESENNQEKFPSQKCDEKDNLVHVQLNFLPNYVKILNIVT